MSYKAQANGWREDGDLLGDALKRAFSLPADENADDRFEMLLQRMAETEADAQKIAN